MASASAPAAAQPSPISRDTMPPAPLKSQPNFGLAFAQDAKKILSVCTLQDMLSVEINNNVNDNFRLQHVLNLSRRHYTFMSWLKQDQYTVKGTFNSGMWFSARAERTWSDSLRSVFTSQFNGNDKRSHMSVDTTYSAGTLGANLRVEREGSERPVATADLTHRLLDGVVLGAQLQCDGERSRQTSLVESIMGAAAVQYNVPSAFTATATVTSKGMIHGHCARRVCHYNKAGQDNVGLAAEFQLDPKTGVSRSRVGMEFSMPNTKATVCASVTGSGKIKVAIKEQLAEWMILRLTTELDHSENDYKFGIGIQVGQSPAKKPLVFNPLPVRRPDKATNGGTRGLGIF